MKSRLKKMSQRRQHDNFVQTLGAELESEVSSYERIVQSDVSDSTTTSWETYTAEIANASLVVTNRLHVALPSALLGKQVVLADVGYHKLRGVYQRSLSQLSNVQLVGNSDLER